MSAKLGRLRALAALMALSILSACGLEYPNEEETALRTQTPPPPAPATGPLRQPTTY